MPKWVKQLIRWGLPSLSAITLINFCLKQKWTEAAISFFITLVIVLLTIDSKWLKKLIERITGQLIDEREPLENLLQAHGKNVAIRLWWHLTSKFQAIYYQSLIYSCRDFKTQGLKTKGPFTLDLEKVFVPLKIAPESAERISPAMIQFQDRPQSFTIWDFLVASNTQPTYRSLALVGASGTGKTTLLEHLTLTYAKNQQRRYHAQAPKLIPILIYLSDANIREAIATKQPSLGTLIEQQNWIRKLNPPPGWFETKLLRQQCLVMLDGLDEVVDQTQYLQISRWLDRQIQDYPSARFLITSLPFAYRSAPLERVGAVLEVQPWQAQQVETFIENWCLQSEIMSRLGKDTPSIRNEAKRKAKDLSHRLKNSATLTAMALNPLLLTMIATVHSYRGKLPERRVELYSEICNVLLGRRRVAKGITDLLTPEVKQTVLQELALQLMKRQSREFSPELGATLIKNQLTTLSKEQKLIEPQQFLSEIENVSGFLVKTEQGVYQFAHQSFQDYLAAVQIKETNQKSFLIEQINDPWWEETIRLYAAQNDASDLIAAALAKATVFSLKLALDCEEEGLGVEPNLREKLKKLLESGLQSPEPEIARLAAEVKLSRRLSKFITVDNIEIDTSYLSCAEYQLFLDAQQAGELEQLQIPSSPEAQLFIEAQNLGELLSFPSNENVVYFAPEDAKKPITGISISEANRFCAWLSLQPTFKDKHQTTHLTHCYRLPTEAELSKYPAQDDEWLFGTGIRLVRFPLPTGYSQLSYYLASGQWKEADKETNNIMLKVANRENQGWLDVDSIENFPCQDLRIIDQLWLQYSSGRFGFSVQKRIWESLGGKLEIYDYHTYEKYGEQVGWYNQDQDQWYSWEELHFSLDAPQGHLPALHSYLRIFIHTSTISSLAQRLVKCQI